MQPCEYLTSYNHRRRRLRDLQANVRAVLGLDLEVQVQPGCHLIDPLCNPQSAPPKEFEVIFAAIFLGEPQKW